MLMQLGVVLCWYIYVCLCLVLEYVEFVQANASFVGRIKPSSYTPHEQLVVSRTHQLVYRSS